MSNKIESFVAATAPVRPVVRSSVKDHTATAATQVAPNDSVRLTGEAQTLARIEHAARDSSGIDEARVADIRRQLAEGRYSPDPAAIAGRLVETEWSLSNRR
ncbi:MAG: flagellar biosynthesis anti-sigma factor FlgM [Panacagrimonas sp.]